MHNELMVSESLRFLFQSGENRNAIIQVLSVKNQKKQPKDFSWSEIESFNTAKVAALKTQADYWSFLKTVWESTWGTVVGADGEWEEVPFNEYVYGREMELVWDDSFCKEYYLQGGRLVLSSFTEEDELRINFSYEDKEGSCETSNGLNLINNWDEVEDDEWFTKKDLIHLGGRSTVNIAMLRESAKDALDKLLKELGG